MEGLELTTLARVKAKAGITGTTKDALIASLIPAISKRAQDFLGRWTESKERTEPYPFEPRKRYLSVQGMPIDTAASVVVWPSTTRNFADSVALDADSFQVLGPEGQLYFPYLAGWGPRLFLQVRYTGGMAENTAAFVDAYPDIADGVENEIIARVNRAQMPEGNLQGLDGQATFLKALEPLKDFWYALTPHKRPI